MFLNWTFLPVNVILAIFQFLMVCTVSYILSIYSRFGGEYASSIRWVHQGGYLEMYNTLVNSRESVPKSTKLILVITILTSFAAGIADVGAVYFIHPIEQQNNRTFQVVNTTQFVPFGVQLEISGWSTFVRNGANITDAMVSMITDTNRIPNAIGGRTYTPRSSDFQAGCNKWNFHLLGDPSPHVLLDQDGCATLSIFIAASFSIIENSTTITNKPNGRRSIKIAGNDTEYDTGYISETSSGVEVNYGNTTCSMVDLTGGILASVDKEGITSNPRTLITKCVLPTGEVVAVSLTSINFSIPKAQNFRRVTSSMFHEDDELIRAMETSVKKVGNKTRLFTEMKLGDGTIDSVSCASKPHGKPSSTFLACMYSSLSAVTVGPKESNPLISAARGGAPFEVRVESTISMTISHIPTITDAGKQQLSISGAKNASYASSHYFASLGQNFYMDWNTSRLYVIYDTVDVERGLNIPLWLSIVLLVTMLFCTVFCLSTQYILDPMYTGSLYKTMSIQMAPKSNSFSAMIRWSKVHSMELEGSHTTPSDNGFHEIDLGSKASFMRIR
ncbi:hypothetical protein BGX27_001456 [Mortierella sp. AM989]|nr:hypothetical protein BGX27_001456 [Mortierella sp. AM989]